MRAFMLFVFMLCHIQLSMSQSHDELSCDGEDEYLEVGECRTCEKCPAGFEPTSFQCGYGTKDKLYDCKPCRGGTYSSTNDYNHCKTCSPCSLWNAETSLSCTGKSDAVCGECFRGYFRPQKSDGKTDSECFKCGEGSTHHECTRSMVDWKIIAVILSGVVGLLVVLVAVICVRLWQRRSKKAKDESEKPTKKSTRNWIRSKMSRSSEVVTTSSLEPLTATTTNHISDELPKELANLSPQYDEATYSNQPTAEFNQYALYPHLYVANNQQRRAEQYRDSNRIDVTVHPQPNHSTFDLISHDSRSTNRLDDLSEINVDSFDTSSISKPIPAGEYPLELPRHHDVHPRM